MRSTSIALGVIFSFALWTGLVQAFEIEARKLYPAEPERGVLKIISTADLEAFEPIIIAFQKTTPGLTVDYTVAGTTDLMTAIYNEGVPFDVAISSAMDLQTKLANDGFAQVYTSPAAEALPPWATWRDQLFAFTQEPAVLVVSNAFFGPEEVPEDRDALISLLRDNPSRFQGKIGTYDIRRSGFGYLIASQDSRNSEAFWRLMEVMGRLDAKLYCCSSDMISAVEKGELALAYNVLGSYAASRLANTTGFRIIEMSDYVNVMLRTALIPHNADNVDDGRRLVDFLLSMNRRPELVEASGLPAIDASAADSNSSLRPIRFGPGLLVFLDKIKRTNFLRNWENSLLQN